jgi:hypothetical protein
MLVTALPPGGAQTTVPSELVEHVEVADMARLLKVIKKVSNKQRVNMKFLYW